ncbi:MAG: hypothetical protein LBR86_08110 [Tannerella sp.]|nr:hypothetical protein [Tannerella sp.]
MWRCRTLRLVVFLPAGFPGRCRDVARNVSTVAPPAEFGCVYRITVFHVFSSVATMYTPGGSGVAAVSPAASVTVFVSCPATV